MSQNNREKLRKEQAAKAHQQRINRIIGIAGAIMAVVLIAVFAVVLIQQQGNANPNDPNATQPPNATADSKAIIVNPGKAAQDAPVVELFFDYQCPICKQFESIYGEALLKLANDGEINLHYRNMVFLDTNLRNDASMRAGVAAACADFAGKYSEFHNEIYVHQPENEGDGYTDEVLRDTIPASVGITADALTTFQKCYDSQSTKAFVQGTNDKALQDGVNGTPTLHVNGKDVPLSKFANVPAEGLGQLIKENA